MDEEKRGKIIGRRSGGWKWRIEEETRVKEERKRRSQEKCKRKESVG